MGQAPKLSPVRIQRLYEADWEQFREIRLRALRQDPQAFSTTAAEAAQLSEAEWRASLRARAAFVAEDGVRLVGLVSGIAAEPSESGDHADAAELISMWVDPDYRGRGIADQLVETVVAWAVAEGYTRVRLCVIEGNSAAERLYRRHGFHSTGERQPTGRGDRMESVMERPLRTSPS